MEAVSSPARSRRRAALLVVLLTLAAVVSVGCAALGVWQLQRLSWKTALIERIERNLAAPPSPTPGPAQWSGLTRDGDEYRRLRLSGRFHHDRRALVRASTELGSGYWVLTPLQTEAGFWVIVNRGFVPPEQRAALPQGESDASLTGLLRVSEPGGSLLQSNDPAQGRWYSRDVAAIAAAGGLHGAVAPYFVDVQALTPADAQAWPRPGLTILRFTNNHLSYALTWFTLAAIMPGTLGFLALQARRRRRNRPAGSA